MALHLAAGIALTLAAWLIPRHVARAYRAAPLAMLLDFAPIGGGALLLCWATGRPLFAGVVVLALGAAFTLADYTMRETLREPVVFSESVELPQVFTHPHLYLPFAGPGLVLGGAAVAVVLAIALLAIEPPLWTPHAVAAFGVLGLIAGGGWLAAYEPRLGVVATVLRGLRPSGEPNADAAALGPFAMLIVHTVIARAERPSRRAAIGAPAIVQGRSSDAVPIIVVQAESFFDARRLSPAIARDFLAGYDACCASGQFGRLAVPGWGANTMRAEFAVLTGIPESQLGYDRFNPYYALARVPIASEVWRLRGGGYRTICLHPFDKRFFRRDLAMPSLGFEVFHGRETLGGSRAPPYCSDPELAGHILHTLDREGPSTFIFAITMGNHGPWFAKGAPIDPAVARLFDPAAIPDGGGLLRYLDGLRQSDEMLRMLMDGLVRRGMPAVLALYGDHLPSLTRAFAHFAFDEPESDYVIWPTQAGVSQRLDLPAHRLGVAIVDAVLGTPPRQAKAGVATSPASAGRPYSAATATGPESSI